MSLRLLNLIWIILVEQPHAEVAWVRHAQACAGADHHVLEHHLGQAVYGTLVQDCAGADHHVEHHLGQVVSGTLVQDCAGNDHQVEHHHGQAVSE